VGSNPISHPKEIMSFERQLGIFITAMIALITLIGCLFWGSISLPISSCVAISVFVLGIIMRERVTEIVTHFFG
jgi:hypothetical protein